MNKDLKNVVNKLNLEKKEGKKHDRYCLKIGEKIIGYFGLSRGSGEKRLPPYAHKQLSLEKSLLNKVAECTANLEDVEKNLRENGVV